MDGINGISTPGTVQGSRQDVRAQSGGRRADGSSGPTATADSVDVSNRIQAEASPSASSSRRATITDAVAARDTAEAARAEILALPMLATYAQANSSAEAVLNMLR